MTGSGKIGHNTYTQKGCLGFAFGLIPMVVDGVGTLHTRFMSSNTAEHNALEVAHRPLQFAYWVPNVSGGLVVSKIEQRTDWSYDYNKRLAVLAENNGFDYALPGPVHRLLTAPPTSMSRPASPSRCCWPPNALKVIAAVHPGLWQPGVLAKLIATADQLNQPRRRQRRQRLVQDEFTKLGEPWLEHDERYRRSEEFITYLREI